MSESVSFLTPTHEELVDVMTCSTAKLKLDRSVERKESAPRRLDERFLASHKHPTPVSLHFLPNLHNEVARSWGKPFSARNEQLCQR